MNKEGDLQIWWIPQVPMNAFIVPVTSPLDAKKILEVLANYDMFQLDNNIKPDYSNAGGLSVLEDGEWVDWYSSEGDSIDELTIDEITDEIIAEAFKMVEEDEKNNE